LFQLDGLGLQAEDEVTLVQRTISTVSQADVHCAMAAWLFILCFVDMLILFHNHMVLYITTAEEQVFEGRNVTIR
jgi:hypothetical protein